MTSKPDHPSNQKPAMGRVVDLNPGLHHAETLMNHQRALAALIAAAYLYKEERSVEAINRLKRAAEAL